MTGVERISNILQHKPTDRIGVYEHFWGDTIKLYTEQGHIKEGEDIGLHFDFDMVESGWLNSCIDLDFKEEIVAETEDTITIKDGNGAILKRHKHHDTTPEHVGFTITCREDWEKVREKLVKYDPRRCNVEGFKQSREYAAKHNKFFMWSGVNVFEQMHPICGHEHMLAGMAEDPDWVRDMCDVLSNLTITYQEELFSKAGVPDGVFYYEDMGYKQSPFMSPAMYNEIIKPYHKRTIDFAKSYNLPVLMHSCGFVEPLLPGMIEAGIDCLQVIEVKAGMDLLRIYKNYGDKLALFGGIDVRTLYTNDKAIIDKELESKIPIVKAGNAYILHSDHSIPNTVEYETFCYFLEKGKSL